MLMTSADLCSTFSKESCTVPLQVPLLQSDHRSRAPQQSQFSGGFRITCCTCQCLKAEWWSEWRVKQECDRGVFFFFFTTSTPFTTGLMVWSPNLLSLCVVNHATSTLPKHVNPQPIILCISGQHHVLLMLPWCKNIFLLTAQLSWADS